MCVTFEGLLVTSKGHFEVKGHVDIHIGIRPLYLKLLWGSSHWCSLCGPTCYLLLTMACIMQKLFSDEAGKHPNYKHELYMYSRQRANRRIS